MQVVQKDFRETGRVKLLQLDVRGNIDRVNDLDVMVHVLIDMDWIDLTSYCLKWGFSRATMFKRMKQKIVPADCWRRIELLGGMYFIEDQEYDPKVAGRRKWLTSAQKNRIYEDFEKGIEVMDIANHIGCGKDAIWKLRQKWVRDGRPDDEEVDSTPPTPEVDRAPAETAAEPGTPTDLRNGFAVIFSEEFSDVPSPEPVADATAHENFSPEETAESKSQVFDMADAYMLVSEIHAQRTLADSGEAERSDAETEKKIESAADLFEEPPF